MRCPFCKELFTYFGPVRKDALTTRPAAASPPRAAAPAPAARPASYPPVGDPATLGFSSVAEAYQHLDSVDFNKLVPGFVSAMNELRDKIFRVSPIKMIGNSPITTGLSVTPYEASVRV